MSKVYIPVRLPSAIVQQLDDPFVREYARDGDHPYMQYKEMTRSHVIRYLIKYALDDIYYQERRRTKSP